VYFGQVQDIFGVKLIIIDNELYRYSNEKIILNNHGTINMQKFEKIVLKNIQVEWSARFLSHFEKVILNFWIIDS